MDHTQAKAVDVPVRKPAKATRWQTAGLMLAIVIVLVWLLPALWTMFTLAP